MGQVVRIKGTYGDSLRPMYDTVRPGLNRWQASHFMRRVLNIWVGVGLGLLSGYMGIMYGYWVPVWAIGAGVGTVWTMGGDIAEWWRS